MAGSDEAVLRDEIGRLMDRNAVADVAHILSVADVSRLLLSSLLESAAYRGRSEFMRLFIEARADINAGWNVTGGCLFAAINGNQPEAVDFLVRHGARRDSIDYQQRNAVVLCVSAPMEATSWSHAVDNEKEVIATLRVLHRHRFDFNQPDNIGYTALHYCADSYYREVPYDCATPIATVLLECGADPDQPDLMNETPLTMAERKGYQSLARLFRLHPRTGLSAGAEDQNPRVARPALSEPPAPRDTEAS